MELITVENLEEFLKEHSDFKAVSIDDSIRLNIVNWVFEKGIPNIPNYLSKSISIVDNYDKRKQPIELKLSYFIKPSKDGKDNIQPNSCDLLCTVKLQTNTTPITITKHYSIIEDIRTSDIRMIPIYNPSVDSDLTYTNYILQNGDRSDIKLVRHMKG